MQDKKMKQKFVLLSIPAETLVETGIFEGSAIQMSMDGKKLVIESAEEPENLICTGDCENCPLNQTDCDGDCANCPCAEECEDAEV